MDSPASQRYQRYAYVRDPPVHVPVVVVSVLPCFAVPVATGATVLTGVLTALIETNAEVACPEPAALLAVTTTRSVWAASALAASYVWAVAPAIAAHEAPFVAQRSHAYVYVIGAEPDQVPVVAVSVDPTLAVPVICGAAVFCGAVTAVTVAVCVDSAVAVPDALCAVTAALNV